MRNNRSIPFSFAVLFILAFSLSFPTIMGAQASAGAQKPEEYTPTVGQEGKDVIWVPTPDELVEAMLDMAKVTLTDTVMDLGSGDGRIVIAAAKRGAHATGFEFNPDMVALSKKNAEKAGVSDKAAFVNADIFASDFSKATVITMYLLPQLNLKLKPTILELKPGTRIVSHAFNMDDWHPDQTIEKEYRTAYLWIVPAKVAGLWIWQNQASQASLKLSQKYQVIEGTLNTDGMELPIKNTSLEGNRISFTAGGQEYSGRVNGDHIEGSVQSSGGALKWTASRNPAK
jgi:SAM-dependent methyltransferase